MVSALSKVFDIVLSDKNAFNYDDPKKIYKLNYYLDVSLNDEKADITYDTEPRVVYDSYAPYVTEAVDIEYSPYYYIDQELYVTISDENYALIDEIFDSLNNVKVEKTPITEQ